MDSKLFGLICLCGTMSGLTALPVIKLSSNQQKIIEGDILMSATLRELTSVEHRRKREITSKMVQRWTNNIVPFVINSTLGKSGRRAVQHAINQFHYHTCVQFVQRTDESDYIAFERNIGCYSPIGRQGGRQILSVGDGCEQRGTIMHELMHALGFFHEHSRYDRDKYVKILWWNIEPDFLRNFESYSHDDLDTLDIPYDYDSLMHYGKLAFSKNRQNTIEAIGDANRPLGQMKRFSKLDIKQILKVYKCKSIDKGPLPAQPLRTFHENEENDDNPVMLTTKTIRKETERLVNKEEEPVTTKKQSRHLLVRPKKHSIEKEQRQKAKYQLKTSKETQNQGNVAPTETVREGNTGLKNQKFSQLEVSGKCRDIYPASCKKFASIDGYCRYWSSFMQKRCPRACGFCETKKFKFDKQKYGYRRSRT
ncbi:zinc metalloproteinase nas-4 [Exaiptasia diaphana]|uniref:Metalloendopeptidase n=1 Tax=Exaiptasia diaphana TaxID=2652724 RepID=A0A913XX50_EXADI|nr:zinc metalloproteinase nas-4 [Exaiptasia diaphana]KXJ24158.1 Zinc metalloproteinase nas-4 [Exaiptasia diaphana]